VMSFYGHRTKKEIYQDRNQSAALYGGNGINILQSTSKIG